MEVKNDSEWPEQLPRSPLPAELSRQADAVEFPGHEDQLDLYAASNIIPIAQEKHDLLTKSKIRKLRPLGGVSLEALATIRAILPLRSDSRRVDRQSVSEGGKGSEAEHNYFSDDGRRMLLNKTLVQREVRYKGSKLAEGVTWNNIQFYRAQLDNLNIEAIGQCSLCAWSKPLYTLSCMQTCAFGPLF